MKYFFSQIIYVFFLSGTLVFANNSAAKDGSHGFSIDFLTKAEIGASCGCFVWLGSKPFAEGKMIYQEYEDNLHDKKQINVKINGQLLFLSSKIAPKVDKFRGARLNQSGVDHYITEDTMLKMNWLIYKISSPKEESARNVFFKTDLLFNYKKRTRAVQGTGYCGC